MKMSATQVRSNNVGQPFGNIHNSHAHLNLNAGHTHQHSGGNNVNHGAHNNNSAVNHGHHNNNNNSNNNNSTAQMGVSARKPHLCPQCSKAFSSTHQLAQHARVHSGEKPYQCSYCERKFKQLSHVQQHTRLHTGERPYKCAIQECGRSFIQLSNLQQHMKTHSQYDKSDKIHEKRFFCSFCGKGFKAHSSLMTHESKQHKDAGFKKVTTTTTMNGPTNGTTVFIAAGPPAHPHTLQQPLAASTSVTGTAVAISGVQPLPLGPPVGLWPCTVCSTVYTTEYGLLAHMEEVKDDPKHRLLFSQKMTMRENQRQNLASISSLLAEYNHQIASNSLSSMDTADAETGSTHSEIELSIAPDSIRVPI